VGSETCIGGSPGIVQPDCGAVQIDSTWALHSESRPWRLKLCWQVDAYREK